MGGLLAPESLSLAPSAILFTLVGSLRKMEASAAHPPQPDASGAMIVRDFIGCLDAGSTLLARTQAAQEHVDVNTEVRAKMRTQLLYHHQDNASE